MYDTIPPLIGKLIIKFNFLNSSILSLQIRIYSPKYKIPKTLKLFGINNQFLRQSKILLANHGKL